MTNEERYNREENKSILTKYSNDVLATYQGNGIKLMLSFKHFNNERIIRFVMTIPFVIIIVVIIVLYCRCYAI